VINSVGANRQTNNFPNFLQRKFTVFQEGAAFIYGTSWSEKGPYLFSFADSGLCKFNICSLFIKILISYLFSSSHRCHTSRHGSSSRHVKGDSHALLRCSSKGRSIPQSPCYSVRCFPSTSSGGGTRCCLCTTRHAGHACRPADPYTNHVDKCANQRNALSTSSYYLDYRSIIHDNPIRHRHFNPPVFACSCTEQGPAYRRRRTPTPPS
jgi:hypothetical protein